MSANLTHDWTIFGPNVRGRTCGACKACCTLVPVQLREGHKPANVRCQHLTSRGCGIYATRPRPCQAWSCRWLMDPDTAAIRRPDLSGYAIDPMLDTILVNDRPLEVIQVWCDPARRDAHRDPALRAYLATMGERFGLLVIVRWDSGDGLVLFPPACNDTGEWQEMGGTFKTEEDMRASLAEVGARSVFDMIVKPRNRSDGA